MCSTVVGYENVTDGDDETQRVIVARKRWSTER